jgi:hypothetical protein
VLDRVLDQTLDGARLGEVAAEVLDALDRVLDRSA